jgi:two-component system OmpR family sensor kinase
MSRHNLPIFARIFGLLVISILLIQLFNAVLVVLFPPPQAPVFQLSQIKAAIIDDASVSQLYARELEPAEMRPQDPALSLLRDRLAEQFGIPASALHVEVAKSPALHDVRKEKPYLDASRIVPTGTPHSGHIDPETLSFSGDFKVGRQLENGNWRVVRPDTELCALWRYSALATLLGTLLFSIPLAYFLASWVVAPLRTFGEAAQRLGRNRHEPPLQLDGPAEIVGAAAAFNEMRERLNRFVDDRVTMMAAIAHDLRTPLTRLAFRLEKVPHDVRIKAEGDIGEMRGMLAAVLTFVRALQSEQPRQRQELRSLINSIADNQIDIGHEVVVEDGPDIVLVGDQLGLRSLFTNLIDNAVKYGGRVCVRLRQEGREAIVEIDDYGPGLPTTELERVFEPFYRGEQSRSRSTGGIGLGLALVRSVAIAHGGHARLENRNGEGLRASVALPV